MKNIYVKKQVLAEKLFIHLPEIESDGK